MIRRWTYNSSHHVHLLDKKRERDNEKGLHFIRKLIFSDIPSRYLLRNHWLELCYMAVSESGRLRNSLETGHIVTSNRIWDLNL
jgi:hypothetical protein